MATTAPISGSTEGKGVLIVQTATLGNTIHTAPSGTTTVDKVTLTATNIHTLPVELTIEWGEATATKIMNVTIPADSGEITIVRKKSIQGALVVTAFAATTNVITLNGSVLRSSAAETH